MSAKTGSGIVQSFSAGKMNVSEVYPFPPGELEEAEFTRRTGALIQRMIDQILSDQFDEEPYLEGALLYLLPTDDPVMTRMSLERAMRVEKGGGKVNLRIIQPTKAAAR